MKNPSRQLSLITTAHLHAVRALATLMSRVGDAYVWLMYRKDLASPLAPYEAQVDVTIDTADTDEMLDVASLYHHDDPEEVAPLERIYQKRLRGGSYCFVARVDGRIVAYNWIRIATSAGIAGLTMKLRADEIYTTDAYTAPSWRGRGIHTALNYAMLRFAQREGYRIAYTLVRADNYRSWVTMPRVGWQHSCTLLYFQPSWWDDKAFWQVHGDPYPMPVGRGMSCVSELTDDAPEDEAGEDDPTQAAGFDFDQFEQRELIGERPWSKTYRLSNEQQVAYLKLVPREHAARLQASAILAKAHPAHIPQVIACEHSQIGWLLTRDHGGMTLADQALPEDLLAMIDTYAKLQGVSVSHQDLRTCLPSTPVAQALPALIDFLRADWGTPDASGKVGAVWFLGDASTAGFREGIGRARSLLMRHLAPATRLPDTLNHGALEPSHAAKTVAGEIVLFNWTHASYGPAGLSLHSLFGGCLLPCRLLQGQCDPQPPVLDANSVPARLMARYLDTLVSSGYADRQVLRAGLAASITAGAMMRLTQFANFPEEESTQRELIRNELDRGLRDLLDLCLYLSTNDAGHAGRVEKRC